MQKTIYFVFVLTKILQSLIYEMVSSFKLLFSKYLISMGTTLMKLMSKMTILNTH